MNNQDRGYSKAEFWNACDQVRIYLRIWSENKELFIQNVESKDIKTLLDLAVNLYNQIYASRYALKVFETMSFLGIEFAGEAFILSPQCQEMEKEATHLYHLIEPKIKSLIAESEWDKVMKYCDAKFGSSKFNLDLGDL